MVGVYRDDRETGCMGNFMKAFIRETYLTDFEN